MIVCAGKSENIKGAIPIGVGLLESVINLNNLIKKHKPNEILFVGSAGSYGGYKIYDKVISYCASQVEISSLLNISYTPLTDLKICNVSCETKTIVNCSNYITSDKKYSKLFLENGYDLENMEFYSVAYIAKKYKLPFRGVFVITNYCDENAHKDFLNNHKEAIKILERVVEDI